MKRSSLFWLTWFLLIYSCKLSAQLYKNIGVDDGLSNRRIAAIEKCNKGYMWFLTENGIDRYDGKEIKQYILEANGQEENSFLKLNWLFADSNGVIWEVGKQGRIFQYNENYDRFELRYQCEQTTNRHYPTPITFAHMNQNDIIWMCGDGCIYQYNCRTNESTTIDVDITENIISLEQVDSVNYLIGTNAGIHFTKLQNNKLSKVQHNHRQEIKIQINEIYYHKISNRVFLGSFQEGVYVYDLTLHENTLIDAGLADITINCISYFNDQEILIGTDGAGVYKMNTKTLEATPYITANYQAENALNGNNIYDIYVDDNDRIWLSNYPFGITIRYEQYNSFNWIRHSLNNPASLVNNQVNDIIEDHEGDLWFATNNGVSLYNEQTNSWQTFLSSFNKDTSNNNHTFISLCEVEPGVIWVGGYNSGIYRINKRSKQIEYIVPATLSKKNTLSDKYIRTILSNQNGSIWLGGYYNLKEVDLNKRDIRYIPNINGIFDICEMDDEHLWVGTANGLYRLHKASGEHERILMPTHSQHIYTIYQAEDSLLYIGTNNAGMLVYDHQKQQFKHFHKDNCALISNNIYQIIGDGLGRLVLTMEKGICNYNPQTNTFINWTKEQGLTSEHFNPNAGILRRNGNIILGSNDGAIEYNQKLKLPREESFRMVLSDLKIIDKTVYPNQADSPLTETIDNTTKLVLNGSQNIFSIKVSTINFNYPSMVLYSWRLKGLNNNWSVPNRNGNIRFVGVTPGNYQLEIRALSNEDRRIILDERRMDITIKESFWLTPWGFLIYTIIVVLLGFVGLFIYLSYRKRKLNKEKINFIINTAHDIRTPLTLIKAPLEQLVENEPLTTNAKEDIYTTLRNVNALLRLTTNLLNTERAYQSSGHLTITRCELNNYVQDIIKAFQSYIQVKHLTLNFYPMSEELWVWMDCEKMESILKNILSNALKYTPADGHVDVSIWADKGHWSIEVKDTGIGIPKKEQKNLFKTHFRGSNVINAKITGSGMGLMLVAQLVKQHKGKITLNSIDQQGTTVTLTFPISQKAYGKAVVTEQVIIDKHITDSHTTIPTNVPAAKPRVTEEDVNEEAPSKKYKLLVVEDNDELRDYLHFILNKHYTVQTCGDAMDALVIVKEYNPDLVITDIMMPEIRGDKLCEMLKNDINTSHIPIILLTALSEEKDIVGGYNHGADEYITKPFNVNILKATIDNLLTNRERIRERFGKLRINDENIGDESTNCANALDWKFIAMVRKDINENMSNYDYNIDVLSRNIGMSRTSFYNKLRALTGMNPIDYIRLMRLNHAKELLKEDKYSITEIAEMVGFSDTKYFREVFKKNFHVSPSEYKKNTTIE